MFSSLRSRLWLTYALVIFTALALLIVALFTYLLRSPILYRQTRSRLKAIETVVLDRQDEFLGKNIKRVLDRTAENFDLRLLLLDAEGELFYDTRETAPKLRLPRTGANTFLRDEDGNFWLYTSALLNNGERLIIATPRPKVKVFTLLKDELLPPFWGAGGLAILLSLLLAFFMARWIADPLQKILIATREVPAQLVSAPEKGPQEVRELTHAFNEMVTRVQNTQESQREFVANVSHELKTPLTAIQGFAQALLDGTAETPKARKEAVQVIYDESSRMHRLALALLDLARFDGGIAEIDFTPLDLSALLRNSVEKFSLRAKEKEVALQMNLPDLPPLMGDGDRLSQVFTNLIDNALKHTGAGDTIAIRAEETRRWIRLEIRDTGEGIPPESLPHIFERFYQADPSRKAHSKHRSGLGLAIVREIVLAHGGKITARSRLNEGASFEIILPLVQADVTTLISKR